MSRIRTSLSFRVRYEGRVQTFDRRPLKEAQAEEVKGSMRYMVARTLTPFRPKWEVSASGKKATRPKLRVAEPPLSPAAPTAPGVISPAAPDR